MPTIIYVDNDDEITSAAARIRGTQDGPVALVLPHGSRISTSRMNFRLLAREAELRGRPLAIVAGDAATRALAASAGLPVFGSVAEFEDGDGKGASSSRAPEATAAAAATAVVATGVSEPLRPTVERWRWPVMPWHIAAGSRRVVLAGAAAAIALALLVAGVAAWVVLPAATIRITPRPLPLAPVSISVTADPSASAPDAASAVVPARLLTFDLAAGDAFAVKGRRVEETPATGRVTFGSKDPTRENRIASGSVVSTQNGIRFRTTATIVIPKASFVGLTVIPGQASVGVEAVKPGLDGNVDPNTITVVPQGEDPVLTYVRNKSATSGGTHQEFPRIDQSDLDAALAALSTQLDDDFESLIREPGRVPAGAVLFDETRKLSTPVSKTDLTTLLGKEVDTFDLEVTSTGTVVAADQSTINAVATQRLRSTVDAEHQVVEGSVGIDIGDSSANGQVVTVPVTAHAMQVRVIDRAALVAQIKGKSISQARSALAAAGDVTLSVWPDWVTTIPTLDGRIDLRVIEPAPGATPSATP